MVSRDATRVAKTQARIARAPIVAAQVLRNADVVDRSPQELLESSAVTVDSEADVLHFDVTDPDPRIAERLASEYARQFIARRLELDTQAVILARRSVEARLVELRGADRKHAALRPARRKRTATPNDGNAADVERDVAPCRRRSRTDRSSDAIKCRSRRISGPCAWSRLRFPRPRPRQEDPLSGGCRLGIRRALARPSTELGRRRKNFGLSMLEEPDGAHAEAFRAPAHERRVRQIDRPANVFLVTSAITAEGKSTTSANLAVAFARAGHRVAVVESDLRSPSLHRLFNVAPGRGVTDVALGHVDLDRR